MPKDIKKRLEERKEKETEFITLTPIKGTIEPWSDKEYLQALLVLANRR